MNRSRTVRAVLAAPILAAGVLATTLTGAGPAVAQPTSGSACTSMAMPATQSDTGTPNSLTRAGQVGAANAPAQTPDAPMDCTAASHG
jgi:hypothetical protein